MAKKFKKTNASENLFNVAQQRLLLIAVLNLPAKHKAQILLGAFAYLLASKWLKRMKFLNFFKLTQR